MRIISLTRLTDNNDEDDEDEEEEYEEEEEDLDEMPGTGWVEVDGEAVRAEEVLVMEETFEEVGTDPEEDMEYDEAMEAEERRWAR